MKVNVSFLFVNLLHNFLGKYLCQHEMLFEILCWYFVYYLNNFILDS